MSDLPFLSWRTLRAPTTTGEALLTEYKPADVITPGVTGGFKTGVLTAVGARLVNIHPATAIIIRGFGKDTAADVCFITISGWMEPKNLHGPGMGHRLWSGTCTLGALARTSTIPHGDGKWGPAATWFEIVSWDETTGVDHVGATELDSVNAEACLLLPTLGYSHILLEILSSSLNGAGEMNEVGFLWRPLFRGEGIITF